MAEQMMQDKAGEMAAQTIPAGYKQTEVGVIPEDWRLTDINHISLVPMQNGLFYEPQRKGKGVPLVNVSDMYRAAPIDVESLELFDATINEVKIFKAEYGDLFFTRSSVVPSGIAYCNIFQSDRSDVVFDSHLIRVRPNQTLVDPRYLYLNCISKHARAGLISEAKTATMTTIDQGAINRCPVLIPPKKEQTAIANVLSDSDALIAGLEQLIAKKQAIKTATMQQLLTGRTRLPQFALRPDGTPKGYQSSELGLIPEDWETGKIESFFEVKSSKRVLQSDWRDRGIPFYRTREIAILAEDGRVDNELFIDESLYDLFEKTQGVPESGDLLVTGIGTVGKAYLVPENARFYFKDASVLWFSSLNTFDADFLMYLYQTPLILKQIVDSSTGTTVDTYTISGAKKTKVIVPLQIEQTAIATMLSDMDNELAALEQKLAKARALKQGMMQQLLTGRIRLPLAPNTSQGASHAN